MDNRKKGIISLVVMVALTVALIFGSDSIYQALYHEPGAGGIQTSAAGFAGDVVVSTTIGSDGTIEDVTVVDVSTETPELGQAAAPEVAAAIVEQQSVAVDGVSGATMTSNAIKSAVSAAITEAGFDPADYGASEEAAAEPAEEEKAAEAAESGEETVTEVVETEAGEETATETAEAETETAVEAAETPPAGETTGLAAGEYEASAAGFGGDVKVSVLVGEAGDIQGVRILDMSSETPDVGQKAAPEIAKAIVMNQSTDVDVVSGATMTSNAVMEAAALALSGEGTPVEAAAPAASDEAAAEPAEEETAAESGEETVTEVVETETPAETEAAGTETEAAAEAAPAGESSGLAAGEYEASAAGFGGDVKVSVAIAEDGSIQSVKLLDISSETPDVGQQAAPEIARAIVVNQTTDVDAVSGATMTSNAVMEAAALALSGEGTPVEGDADGFGEETIAVIGGADGPTSVFVAGKTEDEESTEEETAEESTEAAVETEAADDGVFGTTEYVASAQGYGGEVKVAVVLGSDGVIYDVKILDCSAETEDKGQVAAPQIAQAIVLANSTDVDTVSGATLTSNAVIEAVNSAIASK